MPVSLLTFTSDTQRKHDPPAEFLHGKFVPFFEAPARVERIVQSLQHANLIRLCEPRTIDASILMHTHDAAMIDFLRNLSQNVQQIIANDFAIYDMQQQVTGKEYYYENIFPAQMMQNAPYERKSYIFDSTSPIGNGTWDAVLGSASLAYAGAHAVLAGEARAYAVCRPPGHHAGYAAMGGYCYVNNAAIAAKALKAMGKVAILDVDYHHGNGTQDIFWDDDDVLFISIHADPAVDYPFYTGHTSENHASNLNIPLPHGTDEHAYLQALNQARQAIHAFEAASLVVSLGFDIYKGDPMGKFMLEISAFREIGKRIAAIQLPTLYVQEGGYALEKLGEIALSFFQGIMEDEHAS